jgi:acyl dehydratase
MNDPIYSMATLEQFVGKELGVSDWAVVSQEAINEFASATGDHQWIHVDVERARRESPFGGPVAHGYLTLSMIAGLAQTLGVVPKDAGAALNYGLDRVRFLTPVKAGARIRCRVTLADATAQGGGRTLVKMINTVEIDGEAKPALIAETLATLVSGR